MVFTKKLFSQQRYESLPTAQAASQALLPGECISLSATADLRGGCSATAVNDVSHDVYLQFRVISHSSILLRAGWYSLPPASSLAITLLPAASHGN